MNDQKYSDICREGSVIVIFVVVFATTSTPVPGATPADNIVAVQAVIINLPNYSPAVIPTSIIITGNFCLQKAIFLLFACCQ